MWVKFVCSEDKMRCTVRCLKCYIQFTCWTGVPVWGFIQVCSFSSPFALSSLHNNDCCRFLNWSSSSSLLFILCMQRDDEDGMCVYQKITFLHANLCFLLYRLLPFIKQCYFLKKIIIMQARTHKSFARYNV